MPSTITVSARRLKFFFEHGAKRLRFLIAAKEKTKEYRHDDSVELRSNHYSSGESSVSGSSSKWQLESSTHCSVSSLSRSGPRKEFSLGLSSSVRVGLKPQQFNSWAYPTLTRASGSIIAVVATMKIFHNFMMLFTHLKIIGNTRRYKPIEFSA